MSWCLLVGLEKEAAVSVLDVKLCPRMWATLSLWHLHEDRCSAALLESISYRCLLFSPLCQCLAAHPSIEMIFLLLPWEERYPIVSELCVSDGEVVAVYYSATAAHRRFSLNTLLQNSSGEMFSGVNLVSLLISFPPLFHLFLLPASQHLQTRLRGGEGGEKKLRITRPVQTRYQHVSRVIRLQVYNCKYRWEHPQDTRKMHLRSHPSCVHVRCDCLRNRHPLWTKNKTTGRIYYTLSDLHENHRNVITTCLASPNLPVFSADVCEYAVSTDPATELVNHTILRSP